ncbi:putative nucleoside diphosphate kinase [Onchocerca flexuosa]|uniref:Putative nucleoside diphosphate kinase n=1 Tax=Onchocerca flexuosa TaxID=387005 RepID=A0A238BSZ4_9BILA|nr:putative nucleoside diphosphate kinase [Onchocerca flexuosa]
MLSTTFAMIKPEAVAVPHITKIIWDEILAYELEIMGAKRICMSRDIAEKLYSVHEEKFFYERLIQHIISGPVIVMKLGCATGSAIERWRALMGPSKMLRTVQSQYSSSLRARFALSDTRNLVHGADSQQTANYELSLFSPYPKIHLQSILQKLVAEIYL